MLQIGLQIFPFARFMHWHLTPNLSRKQSVASNKRRPSLVHNLLKILLNTPEREFSKMSRLEGEQTVI